jgi:hypothetical protein
MQQWTVGQGNLFLPLAQDCDSLLFADMRGLWTDGNAAEGNWGLAYRKITPSEWIVGGYLFYDLRYSEFNNTFHQGTAGLELLNVNWGFRVNGYIPDPGTKAARKIRGHQRHAVQCRAARHAERHPIRQRGHPQQPHRLQPTRLPHAVMIQA